MMVQANFAFLKDSKLLAGSREQADRIRKLYAIRDYRDVVSGARLLLESVVRNIFDWENLNKYYRVDGQQRRSLRSDLFYLQEQLDYPLIIFDVMNEIRRMGNDAVHDPNYKLSRGQAWHVICDVNDILTFLLNSYEGRSLNYMRPDIALEAHENKSGKYRKRRCSYSPHKSADKEEKKQVRAAKKALRRKKRSRWGQLRHFLRH